MNEKKPTKPIFKYRVLHFCMNINVLLDFFIYVSSVSVKQRYFNFFFSFHYYFQSIHLSKCSQSSIKNDYSVALLSASSVLEYFMKNTSLFPLLFHWIKHFCSAPIVWRERCVEIRSLCYPFLWTIK